MSSVVVLALLTLAAAPEPKSADAERFKKLFLKGDALYQRGEYAQAILSFREADVVRATPEVAFNLAKCHEKLLDPALATYYYRLYLRRAPDAADANTVKTQVSSALSRATAGGKGYLELEAPGATAGTVGAQSFPELPVAIFLPPGQYEVSAQFSEGTQRKKLKVELGTIATQVFAASTPAVASAVTPPAAGEVVSSGGLGEGGRIASYVLLGVGAAALATGAVFGSMSHSDASVLDRRKDLTVSQAQALANSANSKGRTANLLWIAGGVTASAGVVLLVVTMPEPGMKGGGSP